MTSKFMLSQKTKLLVSKDPTDDLYSVTNWVSASCTAKSFSYDDGEPDEEDVSTFCSETHDFAQGLSNADTFSLEVNYHTVDEAQRILREAKDTGAVHAFKIMFSNNTGIMFLVNVRKCPFSGSATESALKGSLNFRVVGKPVFLSGEEL